MKRVVCSDNMLCDSSWSSSDRWYLGKHLPDMERPSQAQEARSALEIDPCQHCLREKPFLAWTSKTSTRTRKSPYTSHYPLQSIPHGFRDAGIAFLGMGLNLNPTATRVTRVLQKHSYSLHRPKDVGWYCAKTVKEASWREPVSNMA